MRLTNRDRLNLARFGCAFLPKENVICISWENSGKDQALSASIEVRPIYGNFASGPLLALAFEISITKARSFYCYFPFDVYNQEDKRYLSSLLNSGRMQLCFLTDTGPVLRTHDLLAWQRVRANELYGTAISEAEKLDRAKKNFSRAITEFEDNIRLADCFERVLSNTELKRLSASFKAQAALIPPEQRARAEKVVTELLGAFRSRYDSILRGHIQQLPTYYRAFLLMSDFVRNFDGDFCGFAEFMTDACALKASQKDLQELETLTSIVELAFEMIESIRTSSDQPEPEAGQRLSGVLNEIKGRTRGGRGVPMSLLKSLIESFGLSVGGKPGRAPKDYSHEYEWKRAGLSWTKVAKQSLRENPETRTEFGGREFDSLTFEEQENLKNRIREGVRSYASRTGKQFPIQ